MKKVYCVNRIRILAGIMAVMVLLIMLFSSFFISEHADHDCRGEDCPICACIQHCEKTIRGIGGGITAVLVVVMPVFTALLLISFGVPSFQWDTLVSTKVRLNN